MEKIKISEKDFYEKLCVACIFEKYDKCKLYHNCGRNKAINSIVDIEIIPEKTALEKAREFFQKSKVFPCLDDQKMRVCEVELIVNFYEKAIEELQDKLNEKNT